MIATLDRAAHRAEALATFGLRADLPVLLVTGGSQGAASINRAVLGAAQAFADAGVQVLHVTGPAHESDGRPTPACPTSCSATSTGWTSPTPRPTPCSAGPGSNTVTEVSGVGLPAVFVPLPIGNGEQALNARAGDRGRGRAAGRRRRPDAGLGRAYVVPLLHRPARGCRRWAPRRPT